MNNKIFITGENRKIFAEVVIQVLREKFNEGEISIVEGWPDGFPRFSKEAALVDTGKGLFLIFNSDGGSSEKTGDWNKIKKYSFGFGNTADFRASDLHENGGINYKINFRGKTIPVWQKNFSGKKYVYPSLAASAVATILGMNFVEISEALKHCKA